MTFLFVANSDTTYRSLVFTYINEDTKQLANCVKPSARHGIFLRCFCTYNQLQSGILFTAVDCTNPKAFSDVLVVVSVTLGHERSMPLVFCFLLSRVPGHLASRWQRRWAVPPPQRVSRRRWPSPLLRQRAARNLRFLLNRARTGAWWLRKRTNRPTRSCSRDYAKWTYASTEPVATTAPNIQQGTLLRESGAVL